MEIAIISDTHSYLDNKIWKYIDQVDEVWHAGDVGKVEVIDKLAAVKPLYGVYGNIDDHIVRKVLPEFTVLERDGLKIAMTHIGGKPYAYPKKVAKWLDEVKPDIYICGHSHILRVEQDKKRNFLFMNPGACGVHGFHKVKTLLLVSIIDGKAQNLRIVELGPRAKI